AKAVAAARSAKRASAARPKVARRRSGDGETTETVLGRNPVVECLRAGVPSLSLTVTVGATSDERVAEAVHLAAELGVPILEVPRGELDRLAGGALHQG